jgi:polar amino acid transport system substrate-binding protein
MVALLSRFFLVNLFFSCWVGIAFTHATESVPIFVLEEKGHHGKPVPVDKGLQQLIAYIERESGLHFELTSLPWNRAKMMASSGSGIVYGMSKSPERLPIFRYSLPVKTEQVWAITYGENNPTINSMSDLRGRTITLTRGFTVGMEFEQVKNTLFKVEETYDLFPDQLKKLSRQPNNVLLWAVRELGDTKQFQTYFHNVALLAYNDPDLAKLRFNVSSKPVFFDTSHFASVKGKFETEMDKIDEVLLRGGKNGELAKVLRNKK